MRSERPRTPGHRPASLARRPGADRPEFIADPGLLRRRRTLKWQVGEGDPERICLGVAEMDLYAPRFLRAVLDDAIHLGETGYGLTEAQEAACAHYLARQHGARVAGLRCTTDVLTGLRTLMRQELEPGSAVLVETPVYGDLFTVVTEAGLVPVPVPLRREPGGTGWCHDWAALDRAAAAGARAWVLCQPHNPVGRAWTGEEIAEGVALARRHDLLLLANEVHIPLGLTTAERQPPSVFADPDVHRVRAFGFTSASKAFNIPGLKSATLYSSERSARALAEVPQSLVGRPGSLGAVATVTCYEQGMGWLEELRDRLTAAVRLVRAELADLPLAAEVAAPDATYLVWAEFPHDDDAARFARALESTGIHLLPGEAFGGPGYAHCFRLNAASHPTLLRAAFTRLRPALWEDRLLPPADTPYLAGR